MPSPRASHRLRLAAVLACAGALGGCAAVTIAGAAAGAAVSIGGAVVGSTVKVAGKVVEKTIDLAVPSSTPEPQK
jgi:hypothetical protein